MWGPTGWDRLFNASFGGQISWLLPAALILLVGGLLLTMRAARTDRTRAAFLLWGGSLAVMALVFSFAAGIIHPYYTVALAPAIGALVGMGSVLLWRHRAQTWARLFSPPPSAPPASGRRSSSNGARPSLPGWRRRRGTGDRVRACDRRDPAAPRRGRHLVIVVALASVFAGPASYTIDTVLTPHSGAIPSAGPAVTAALSGGGPAAGGFGAAAVSAVAASDGGWLRSPGGFGGGGFAPAAASPAAAVSAAVAVVGGGTGGNFLNASAPGADLVKLLETDASQLLVGCGHD